MVLGGSENESLYLNLSCAKYPRRTINTLSGNLTRGALPDDNKLHLLESIGQSYDQSSCRSGVLTAFRSQEFHFEQRFPRRHFRTTDIFGARIPFNDPVVSPSTKDGDLFHTHNLMIVEGSKGDRSFTGYAF